MLISMTGFGRAETFLDPAGQAIVEIHTLNHKFLEVECRLPEGFDRCEGPIRLMVGSLMRRGRVRVTVGLKGPVKSRAVFQEDLARRYVKELTDLKRRLGLPGAVSLETILALPQVVAVPPRELFSDRVWPSLKRAVAEALAQAVAMRKTEGKRLSRVLKQLVEQLEATSRRVRQRIPAAQAQLRRRFAIRIRTLAQEADQRSVASEAAAMVQATDVSEEVARIGSHLTALRQVLDRGAQSPGRTIDFLGQELTREVNTLAAKIRQARVIQSVVAMKNQIEKLREQAANVE